MSNRRRLLLFTPKDFFCILGPMTVKFGLQACYRQTPASQCLCDMSHAHFLSPTVCRSWYSILAMRRPARREGTSPPLDVLRAPQGHHDLAGRTHGTGEGGKGKVARQRHARGREASNVEATCTPCTSPHRLPHHFVFQAASKSTVYRPPKSVHKICTQNLYS